MDGLAEVFGAELPPESPVYYTRGSKFAVFTWHKAKILITGQVDSKYIRSSTIMQDYLELHANIQEDRENALISRTPGPNVVVWGSPGSGKSTLCKILINYALKMGNRPIYIDLDIENNEIVPSGWIGAAKVKMPLPNDDLNEESICMYYGFKAANMVKSLYKKQISELSEIVKKKIENKKEEMQKEYADLTQNKQHTGAVKSILEPYSTSKIPLELASGCVINTMITPYEPPEKTIKRIAKLFSADYIIVIHFEKLYVKLREEYKTSSKVKLREQSKFCGIINAGDVQNNIKNMSYRRYFHGKFGTLDTCEWSLPLDEWKLYTIEILQLPLSAQPKGAKEDQHMVTIKLAEPENILLQNKIVGVLDPIDVDKLEALEKDGEKENEKESKTGTVASMHIKLIKLLLLNTLLSTFSKSVALYLMLIFLCFGITKYLKDP